MPRKRVFKEKELKGPPPEFACKECGSTKLKTVNSIKANINIEGVDGVVRKEQIRKRYRDCIECGTRWVTFETIQYKVRRQGASVKTTRK